MASQAFKPAIRHPNLLMPLSVKLPGNKPADALLAKYRSGRCHTVTALPWIEVPFHKPLRTYFSRRWEERTDPFWWSAVAYKQISNKKTVRSSASRKLRHAFKESLMKKGYAADGNLLPGTGGPPLTGTAQLQPLEPILKIKMEDLILQTDATLGAILDDLGRKPRTKAVKKQQSAGKRQEHDLW